jgi:hypothetical protein
MEFVLLPYRIIVNVHSRNPLRAKADFSNVVFACARFVPKGIDSGDLSDFAES